MAALATACSGGGDAPIGPDANLADAAPACEAVAPGAAFELRFGVTDESGEFDELLDGEDCPIRLGNQGILMLVGELRAVLPDAPNRMCCTTEVGPSGDFEGRTESAPVPVEDRGSELSAPTLTLLAGREMEDTLDGAELTVAWSCADGEGGSGSVERSVRFFLLEQ